MSYRIKLKNWKLGILALMLTYLLASLGNWQLSRAEQKTTLLRSFEQRKVQTPLSAQQLSTQADWRFYRTKLTGQFDNQHTVLMDNKIFHGQVGYEIYTPFKADGLAKPILIDRGFIPVGVTRSILPMIRPVNGIVTIQGMVNLPPTYVALSNITEKSKISWPLRIAYINVNELNPLIDADLFSYIVTLSPHDAAAYPLEWQIVMMGPERHRGYAVQWFALALTLLILSVALNLTVIKK